jgi:hypothetical protein
MKIFNYELCSPALIYLVFSMTQVVVDTIKGLYNVALLKFTMMILFTLLLNILCERGLGMISWIIVFIPFILMSVITSILLFVFGLDPSSGVIIPPASASKPTSHSYPDPRAEVVDGVEHQENKKEIRHNLSHSSVEHKEHKNTHHHTLSHPSVKHKENKNTHHHKLSHSNISNGV